jgi:hypothetical protein
MARLSSAAEFEKMTATLFFTKWQLIALPLPDLISSRQIISHLTYPTVQNPKRISDRQMATTILEADGTAYLQVLAEQRFDADLCGGELGISFKQRGGSGSAYP